MIVGYGLASGKSFAKFNPDMCSLKTCQLLFQEADLLPFSGRWPRWGMMLRGECFPVAAWEPVISETEYSSLDATENWPTPLATPGSGNRSGPGAPFRPSLQNLGANQNWPTPSATVRGVCASEAARNSPCLQQAAADWPTPKARDCKRGGQEGRNSPNLLSVCRDYGPQVEIPKNGHPSPSGCYRLNSLFVEWLMGFPENHSNPYIPTELLRWEMQLAPLLRQWLGPSLSDG